MADVVAESPRIARRHQADVISPAYVRQAGEHLGTRSRRRVAALAGSLGWAAMGSALPSLLDLTAGKPMAPPQAVVSAGLGMLGAFLVAVQFLRE